MPLKEQTVAQISIVSACRNEAGHIREFLDSIVEQDFGDFKWEAIIADGMSNDGTREVLTEYAVRCPNILVIENRNLIVSTGLNAAIRAASGKIILRMDAHTTFAKDYCLKCVQTLIATNADNVGGPARTKALGTRARAIAAAYHSRFSTGGARFHDPNFEGWVDTVPYGCWRKDTLERLGLFDEELIRNQDDELNLRTLLNGGRVWQTPEIRSWYSPRSTIRALFNQYFQYGFWKVMVARKHRQTGSWRHFVPVGFVSANALLIGGSIFAFAIHSLDLSRTLAVVWITMMALYLTANICASILTARRSGWRTLIYLPFAFAAFHLSYGCGFLTGMALSSRPSIAGSHGSLFSRITR